jgi:Nuclease-related domain
MDGKFRGRRAPGPRTAALAGRAHRLRARNRGVRAEAERVTASYLDPHSGDGWFVLHDLAVPGAAGGIDHLVITPAGVFIVNSLGWSEAADEAGLVSRPWDQHPETGSMAAAVRAVGDILASVVPDLRVDPDGVICLTGCPSAARSGGPIGTGEHWEVGNITVVPVAGLIRHLSKGPQAYDPERVEQLAIALDHRLTPRSGGSSSLVRPSRLAWPDRRPTTAGSPGPLSTRPPASPIGSARLSEMSRAGGRAGDNVVLNVLRTLVAVVGLVLFFYCFADWSRALPRVTTSAGTGPSSAWVPSTPPASLRAAWSCPAGIRGWTATLAWPTGPPSQAWMAEVSPSPGGPWTTRETGSGSREATLTGLQPGTTEWVRVETVSERMISAPIMKGPLLAPNGC